LNKLFEVAVDAVSWQNAIDSAMIVFEFAKRFQVEKSGRKT
jgi:hypothetical protein